MPEESRTAAPGSPSFARLDPAAIDTADSPFRVRSRHPEALLDSVRAKGVRTPLIVEPVGERYRLISGWGRIRAASPGRPVPCHVLAEGLSRERLWDVFLEDNDAWNVVEIARILQRLETLPGLDPERIVAEKFPLLGVHASMDLYRRHRSLLSLGERGLDFVEEERLPLRRASLLLRLPAAAVELLIEAARDLKLTLNEVGETIEWIEEIAARDARDPEEVLRAVRAEAGESGKAGFRRILRTLRFPETSRYQARLEALEGELEFTMPVRIEWDPKLDRPGIRLRADLAEPEALEQFERELRKNREVLRRFFEIL